MSLGMSIFLEWFSALVIGTLLGLAVSYIFGKNNTDVDEENDANEDKDEK